MTWSNINRGCCCCEQDRLFRWAAQSHILRHEYVGPIDGVNGIISYIQDLERRAGVKPDVEAETPAETDHRSIYSNRWVTCACGWDPAEVIPKAVSSLKDAYKAMDRHRKEMDEV